MIMVLLQDGIVTMVDAKHVHKRLDDEVPAGAINEALEQIAYADRLILNKSDLVSLTGMTRPPQLRENTEAPTVADCYGKAQMASMDAPGQGKESPVILCAFDLC